MTETKKSSPRRKASSRFFRLPRACGAKGAGPGKLTGTTRQK